MVAWDSPLSAVMLAFLFGFATIRAEEIPEGVMPKRQVVGTGVTSSTPQPTSNTPDPTSNTPDPTSNTPDPTSNAPTSQSGGGSTSVPTTIDVTTTNADGSTVVSQISTNTLAPTSKSAVDTATNKNGNSVVKVGSKTINPSTLSHKTTVRQPLVTKQTRHETSTSFWTSNGRAYSSVYTTEDVFASTTGFATATIAPGLANGGGNGSNLSTNSKKIIGGVVGGIGGAILIGGLAFVAWRLWGKKKNAAQDGDEYYQNDSNEGSIQQQKRASMGTVLSGSAYSDTNGLERYQNPGGTVNTGSNF